MIIDRITLYHLRMPLRSPFETSFGRIPTATACWSRLSRKAWSATASAWPTATPGYSYETVATAWRC